MSELGWTLRGGAANLNAVAAAVEELDAKRWRMRRYAAILPWEEAGRSHIEGWCECADELIEALAEALR